MTVRDGERDVFVNCPFDGEFEPLFHAIVFAVLRCGFRVRCALEVSDAGDTRIAKIGRLIGECPFGIHDISRTELDAANRLPRFNMPFELGLFLGAKMYGEEAQRRKRSLVLEREPYAYQKYLSDIAGQDIYSHGNDPGRAMGHVRDFLNTSTADRPLVGIETIVRDYERFERLLPGIRTDLQLDERLAYPDFLYVASDFVSEDR